LGADHDAPQPFLASPAQLTAEEEAAWAEHAAWLAATPLEFVRKVVPGTDGTLYASLAADAIASELDRRRPALGVRRDSVQLPERIKSAGTHTVQVALPLPAHAPAALPRAVAVTVRVVAEV
jgi:ribosomal protein L9